MKKMLSMLLALVMVLSLAACGSNDSADTGSGSDNDAEAAVDFRAMLINGGVFWGRVNRNTVGVGFLEDGTTVEPDGTWELDGHVVNCTWADGGTESYEFKELDGVYYLVGDDMIMYSDLQIRPSEIPSKAVEITLDNWQEYFEFTYDTEVILDQFGEPTGEIREYHYLELKPEYNRIVIEKDSEVLIRYTENGEEKDACLRARSIDCFGEVGIRNDAEHVFEMVKVQGTLHFIDGI